MVDFRARLSTAFFLSSTLSCFLAPARADACGGCFHAEESVAISAVTGHRMAFAVSETRTVLWDQIQYSGSPTDFSWVLPVRPGAYVEASTDAWFEALDGVTQVRVGAPPLNCAAVEQRSSGGIGCGSSTSTRALAAGDDSDYVGNSDVVVVHQGTVGPYQTVTLHSTDPDALANWLRENRYVIPADIEPVISAYVAEQYDFIALRLRPSAGVQQMTPVRVVTPGGEGRLPLRMVAAGIGESVDIVLYVLAESRARMPDIHEVKIDAATLTWDFSLNGSNYLELRRQALARNLGFSYLTAFADPQMFNSSYQDPQGAPLTFVPNGALLSSYNNFWSLYFAQARANDGLDVQGDCPYLYGLLGEDAVVAEEPESGELAASEFACGEYTDIAAAMVGMHPARVWTTRLELDLPKEALSMDCVIDPAEEQEAVSQVLRAPLKKNPPCAETSMQNRIAGGRSNRAPWVVALFAALVLARRVRRRPPRPA